MAVNLYENHRPREASMTVSLAPDFSGDYVAPGVADEVTINAAIAEVVALGGGEVVLGYGDYALTATVNVPANVFLRGVGWETVLNYDAGGNCITITGDNVKLRDFKVVIVAGAGAGGTRPNCVYATGRTNVEITKLWLYGDITEAADGSDLRQCGIVFGINMAYSKILDCTIENFERNGISFVGTVGNEVLHVEVEGNICYGTLYHGILTVYANYCMVIGNTLQGNTQNGIALDPLSDNCMAVGNTCQGNGAGGIIVDTSFGCTISGNNCNDNTATGILITGYSPNCTLTGNTCNGNTWEGIRLASAPNCTLTGNTCNGNALVGIDLFTSSGNTLVGNTIFQNVRNGIKLDSSSNNTIVGNTCNENDVNNTNTYDGICIEDDSDYNLVMGNTCNENDRWGISIGIAADDCVGNWVKNNHLRGNTSGPFSDQGTDTKLATIQMPFIQGTTFISADGSAKGWEINAEADMAVALGQLPLEVQQIVRIKIWAVALGAPAGAGGQMHLDILFNAGGSLEAYNLAANSWTLADFDGEEADYVNTNVIHWMIEDGDVGNELINLLGGDSLELKVNGALADAPDGETNATFRVVEIEYV